MAVDFSKFDRSMDLEGLKKDIAEASSNRDFKEVPHGKYEVEITKLELSVSKKGDPMFVCWMKILEGEYEGSLLFMNQVITKGFQVHIVNQFLRDLVDGMDKVIGFISYADYANIILDVAEAIDGKREYLVDYADNNGFSTFKIEKVYNVED